MTWDKIRDMLRDMTEMEFSFLLDLILAENIMRDAE